LAEDLAFFIEPAFWACRRPCADDTDHVVLLGVGHGEEPPATREAKRDPSDLVDRVIWVRARDCQGIGETVLASSKETLCFLRFAAALRRSQVTSID
jgi:hypothetical protein